MNRPTYYILDGHTPAVEDDLFTWADWFETADRRVARTEMGDGTVVSTVFLGLDHQFAGHGPPILFETMVFDGDGHELVTRRYASWEEAEAGHALVVAHCSDPEACP